MPACREELPVEIPAAPSTSGVRRDFDNPTESIENGSVSAIATSLAATLGLAEDLGFCTVGSDGDAVCGQPGFFEDILRSLGGAGEESAGQPLTLAAGVEQQQQAMEDDEDGASAEGFFRITRTCRGWEGSDTPDEGLNGRIRLTGTFRGDFGENLFDPLLWGELRRCRFLVDQAKRLEMRTDLWVHVGDLFGADEAEHVKPLLFHFRGDATLDDADFDVDLDFRILPASGEVQFLVPHEGGHVVFYLLGEAKGFYAENGTWTCDFGVQSLIEGACENEAGVSVTW